LEVQYERLEFPEMDAFKIPYKASMRLRHVILPHLAAASYIQISKHRVKVEKPKKVILHRKDVPYRVEIAGWW